MSSIINNAYLSHESSFHTYYFQSIGIIHSFLFPSFVRPFARPPVLPFRRSSVHPSFLPFRHSSFFPSFLLFHRSSVGLSVNPSFVPFRRSFLIPSVCPSILPFFLSMCQNCQIILRVSTSALDLENFTAFSFVLLKA